MQEPAQCSSPSNAGPLAWQGTSHMHTLCSRSWQARTDTAEESSVARTLHSNAHTIARHRSPGALQKLQMRPEMQGVPSKCSVLKCGPLLLTCAHTPKHLPPIAICTALQHASQEEHI